MTTAKDYVTQRGLSTLQRPRYTAGLLLEDEDLTAAVDYTRNMTRLLFQSLFGCGVICGLEVTAKLTCLGTKVEVQVGKGVALDCMGNPIHLPKADRISFDAECKPLPKCLWVTVCYFEKCCRPKDVSCSPDDDAQRVPTRQHDGYEIRLYPTRPKCMCWCENDERCKEPGGKTDDECCKETEAPEPPKTTPVAAPAQQVQGVKAMSLDNVQVHAHDYLTSTDAIQTGPPKPAWPDVCECFTEHYAGKCGCDCCCDCVLIGTIQLDRTDADRELPPDKTTDIPLKVHRDVVRRIRPMLIGYRTCFDPPPAPAEKG